MYTANKEFSYKLLYVLRILLQFLFSVWIQLKKKTRLFVEYTSIYKLELTYMDDHRTLSSLQIILQTDIPEHLA